jgi:hypothetical protein
MESIEVLKNEIDELRKRNSDLEERLKKYTYNDSHKKYYNEHKDTYIKHARTYIDRLKEENPEKLKEYRRRAYLKRKEKMNEVKSETF